MCAAREPHPTVKASFADRANNAVHPLSNYLLRLMELKKSNLCLSADVTTARELLTLADGIGPSIVILKTHYDLVSGWDYHPKTGTGAKLGAIARKHGFLIFEDRKFGDIGNTVQMQYTAGTARIIDWAHIVNINMVPGKAGVAALSEAAKRWRSRVNYEVNTSVTVGTPVSESFDGENAEDEEEADHLAPSQAAPPSVQHSPSNGRKGSIVSITTVTQSFEPVDSPRFASAIAEGDEQVYAGIEEPPYERALLILAQMSTEGNFMNAEYTRACQEAAREHKDFVMGFISQGTLNTEAGDDFISMTPGCQLPPDGDEEEDTAMAGDGLGQQYNTPDKLVGLCGSDIIILPCTNCQSRNKHSACRYETGAPVAKNEQKDSPNSSSNGSKPRPPPAETAPSESVKAADFGYMHDGVSTLANLRRIEGAGYGPLAELPSSAADSSGGNGDDSFGMRERYKTLIRQLPAKTYIEKLFRVYFRDINWQYNGVDEPIVRELMDRWYGLPFHVLSSGGPQALDPMLRAFPALLFQMLASALLYLPEEAQETFECLKYTSNMTFDDLAFDYSESGMSILTLLGKRQMSVMTVLAGWVRAAFLKYTGMVTEAWHQVGTSIRDAQEIGLHRDQMDPQVKPDDSAEEVIDKTWMAQARRTIWLTLLAWDLHTGAVLGRPTSVDFRVMSRSLPLDAILPKSPNKVPLIPRSDNDPPTPLTRAIWSFKLITPLRDILDLEKEGPFPKDFSRVEKIHQEILTLDERMPPPFRLKNPDTRFDDLPECWWLPNVRPNLPQLTAFNLMALHRPYVFTRAASRHEALKASLDMLEAQRQYYAVLQPSQHRTFALFFGTFDAIVMLASIYILFPREHPELLTPTRQHFQWAVERFEKMAWRNRLAHAALGVLHAIWIRFKKAVGGGGVKNGTAAASESAAPDAKAGKPDARSQDVTGYASPHRPSVASGTATATATGTSRTDNGHPTPLSDFHTPADGGGAEGTTGGDGDGNGNNNFFAATGTTATTTAAEQEQQQQQQQWSLPPDFDFASIMPMYPIGDVAYNDLTGVTMTAGASPNAAAWPGGPVEAAAAVSGFDLPVQPASAAAAAAGQDWQFGGEFGSDTIWNLLNQFPPH
ncbi:Orotidine 5'-phosphate decarboxylase [Xylariomycetidae sp. FL0641]|nr:Orotidine 5'-phosphate decarboxylase [Xylariomycetidae sp. FL0641]